MTVSVTKLADDTEVAIDEEATAVNHPFELVIGLPDFDALTRLLGTFAANKRLDAFDVPNRDTLKQTKALLIDALAKCHSLEAEVDKAQDIIKATAVEILKHEAGERTRETLRDCNDNQATTIHAQAETIQDLRVEISDNKDSARYAAGIMRSTDTLTEPKRGSGLFHRVPRSTMVTLLKAMTDILAPDESA